MLGRSMSQIPGQRAVWAFQQAGDAAGSVGGWDGGAGLTGCDAKSPLAKWLW